MIALFLFHTRVGGRLAVRSAVPLFAALLAAIMMDIDPAAVMRMLGLALFGESPSAGVQAAAVATGLAIATWASPRLRHGLHGWLRHLPVSEATQRRGAVLSLVAVQIPVLVALLLLLAATVGSGVRVFPTFLLRFFIVSIAAAYFVLPLRRRFLATLLSSAAIVLALVPSVPAAAVAATLLVACDLAAGGIRGPSRRRTLRPTDAFLLFRIAWRALAWRLATALLAALLPLICASLFVANNELTPGMATGAWRFGGTLSVVLFLYGAADRLVLRRPVWPWLRSLPLSSLRRVSVDAGFLGSHAFCLAFLVAFWNLEAAFAVIFTVPFLALRAAAHMCRARERKIALGPLLLEGTFSAGIVGLLPWTSFLFMGAVPIALLAAAAAESQVKVTRWRELHHAADGDSLSWNP